MKFAAEWHTQARDLIVTFQTSVFSLDRPYWKLFIESISLSYLSTNSSDSSEWGLLVQISFLLRRALLPLLFTFCGPLRCLNPRVSFPGLVYAQTFPSVEIGISDEIVEPGLEATLSCRVQNQGSFRGKNNILSFWFFCLNVNVCWTCLRAISPKIYSTLFIKRRANQLPWNNLQN